MIKSKISIFVVLASLMLSSCYTMKHQVGSGAAGNTTVQKKQWYALWGLVPINKVDSKDMAGDATNYNIETKFSFIDLVIGAFTGLVSIQPKTVEVTK